MSAEPKTHISQDLYQYLLKISQPEESSLKKIRDYTENLPNSIMQISLDQGKFMQILAQIMQAKKYLEVGVFTGYSALCMAKAMGESGQVYALEIDSEYVKIAQKFWTEANCQNQIIPYIKDAKESLQELLNQGHANTFDIIFIDANKSDYLDYYEYAYKLIRKGGVILVDNTFMLGKVLDENAPKYVKIIDQLNHLLCKDDRVTISVTPIGDGLTLVYKK